MNNPSTDSALGLGTDLRRAGRPAAKHSSPDYAQITVYCRKDVRKAVKIRLFEEGLELSALVERLLSNWLVTPQGDR